MEAEALAQLQTQGIQYADKQCRRLFRGLVPFSPKVHNLMLHTRFWKLVFDKQQGRKISSRLIVKVMKKANIETPLRDIVCLPQHSVLDKLKESYRQYKTAKQSAFSTRRKWLEDLAEAQSQKENASVHNKSRTHPQLHQSHHRPIAVYPKTT